MSEYIINPTWFYWVNIVNSVKTIMLMLTIISLIATLFTAFFSLDEEDSESKYYEKIALKMSVVTIVCLIIAVFIPTKETLIEMQIAKYATWENTEWTIEAIKDVVDYIINAIN